VRELINYLSRALQRDAALQNLGVKGEVSGYKEPGYGYAFFELKEANGAVLQCFIGASSLRDLTPLQNGMEIIAFGAVGVHRDRSVFQLYVSHVRESGAGKESEKYERIKRRLAAEGLFDPGRKRPIPRFPFRIALVSSPTAEGANDFIRIARGAGVVLVRAFDAIVQGPDAPHAIATAVARAVRWHPDVIVIARGGGSDKDRLPFNEEVVSRAVAASPIPVITAIGHFGDHHIVDDVADQCSGTPSDAAKSLVEPVRTARNFLTDARGKIRFAINRGIEERASHVERLSRSTSVERFERIAGGLAQHAAVLSDVLHSRARLALHRRAETLRSLERRLRSFDPAALLAERRARLSGVRRALNASWASSRTLRRRDLVELSRQLSTVVTAERERRTNRLAVLAAAFLGKDPVAILQQGYAIVRSHGGVVRDAGLVRPGESIEAQLWRGKLRARVEEVIGNA
jgi:exodeoxyribonuclease VII large subunit